MLARTLLGIGAAATVVGQLAHHYHGRRFDEFQRELSAAETAAERSAVAYAFFDDDRVDRAISLMVAREVGVVMLAMGLALRFL